MDDLTSIITDLERQRDAIDRALSALREVSGAAPSQMPTGNRRGRPPGRRFSAETRRRMSEAQRRRYAQQSAQSAPERAKPAAKTAGLTAAGRKRLSELMKARWASKNPPKKVGSKKAS